MPQVMLPFSLAHYLYFHIQSVCLSHFVKISIVKFSINAKRCVIAVNLNDVENGRQSIDDLSSGLKKFHQNMEGNDPIDDIENHAIGSLLPGDEKELLAGIADDLDLSGLPGSLEDLEDYDLFGSGGGMELESDPQDSLRIGISRVSLSDGSMGNGMVNSAVSNGVGTVAGEHPYGEHPSRTLFVRNINSNVEDSELRALFEVIHLTALSYFYVHLIWYDFGSHKYCVSLLICCICFLNLT